MPLFCYMQKSRFSHDLAQMIKVSHAYYYPIIAGYILVYIPGEVSTEQERYDQAVQQNSIQLREADVVR